MVLHTNPFSRLDEATVIGFLKSTGSRDLDVLGAKRTEIEGQMRGLRFMMLIPIVCGIGLSLTIIGAIIGIPLIAFGWYMRRKLGQNLAAVEAGFQMYAGQVTGAAA